MDRFELPAGLEFQVNEERMSSPAFPGFFVVDGSAWKKRLGIDQLIVLENGDAEQKILLRTGDSAWNYCLLDTIKSPNKPPRLRGSSPKDQLNLIHQLFLKKRYSQANRYLQELNFVKGMDAESEKLLGEMVKSPDAHPDAILLKLRFALQLAKNLLFYRHKKWEDVQKLIEMNFYPNYLQQLGTDHSEPLTREEELELIRLSQTKSPQHVERIRFLNGKESMLKSTLSPLNPVKLMQIFMEANKILTFKKEKNVRQEKHLIGPVNTYSDEEEFDKIYHIARYGNKQERERLKKKIELTNPNGQDYFRYTLIKCLLAFPTLFSGLIYFNGAPLKRRDGLWAEIKQLVGTAKRTPAYLFFLAYSLFDHSRAKSTDYEFPDKGLDRSLSATLSIELPERTKLPLTPCLPIEATLFQDNIREEMNQILTELNTYPDDALTLMQRLGDQIKPVKEEEALTLFLKGRLKEYQARNPFLSEEKIKEIDAGIARLLVRKNPDPSHLRAYDSTYPSECIRAYLVFEYRNHLFLRRGQVESLKKIWGEKNRPAIISKQGTGSGKSKVQLPLLQYLFQMVQSTFNVWPKSLFPQTAMTFKPKPLKASIKRRKLFPLIARYLKTMKR